MTITFFVRAGSEVTHSKILATSRRSCAVRTHASAIALVLSLTVSACSHGPTDPEACAASEQSSDPAEPTNRVIFAGNKFVDDHALQPIARGYQDYLPSRIRNSVHNFVSNLGQPSVAVNDALQGNVRRSWNTIQRFAINSTFGGVGLFDVASDWHHPGHLADFGQTLGVWGVGPGPSVQLPLFGPSNVRDSIGKVGDLITNPMTFIPGGVVVIVNATSGGAGFIDRRADLLSTTDSLEKDSVDYYAALRSVAAQRRAAFVAEGRAGCAIASEDSVPSALVQVPQERGGDPR